LDEFLGDITHQVRHHFFPKDIAAGKRQYFTNQSGMVMPIATVPKYEIVRVVQCSTEPDWNSLQLYSFTPGHASTMCSRATEGEQNPYPQCPRHLLEKTLREIQKNIRRAFSLDSKSCLRSSVLLLSLLNQSIQAINQSRHDLQTRDPLLQTNKPYELLYNTPDMPQAATSTKSQRVLR